MATVRPRTRLCKQAPVGCDGDTIFGSLEHVVGGLYFPLPAQRFWEGCPRKEPLRPGHALSVVCPWRPWLLAWDVRAFQLRLSLGIDPVPLSKNFPGCFSLLKSDL